MYISQPPPPNLSHPSFPLGNRKFALYICDSMCHTILMTTLGQALGPPSFHRCENEGSERLHYCPRSHTTSKWQRQALNPSNWILVPTQLTPCLPTSLKCGLLHRCVMVNYFTLIQLTFAECLPWTRSC